MFPANSHKYNCVFGKICFICLYHSHFYFQILYLNVRFTISFASAVLLRDFNRLYKLFLLSCPWLQSNPNCLFLCIKERQHLREKKQKRNSILLVKEFKNKVGLKKKRKWKKFTFDYTAFYNFRRELTIFTVNYIIDQHGVFCIFWADGEIGESPKKLFVKGTEPADRGVNVLIGWHSGNREYIKIFLSRFIFGLSRFYISLVGRYSRKNPKTYSLPWNTYFHYRYLNRINPFSPNMRSFVGPFHKYPWRYGLLQSTKIRSFSCSLSVISISID